MAQDANELFSTTTRGASPRVMAKTVFPKSMAAEAAAVLVDSVAVTKYPVLMPLAFNTSTNLWVPWVNGGANGEDTIRGFVFPDEWKFHATNETTGQVLLEGRIHFDDIIIANIGASDQGTVDELKTACRSGMRERGIYVEGLDEVR